MGCAPLCGANGQAKENNQEQWAPKCVKKVMALELEDPLKVHEA